MDQSNTSPDVSMFEAADTAILDVLDARGEPLMYQGQPVQIEMYGPGSDQATEADAKIARDSQARVFAAMRSGKAAKGAADEARKDQVDKLVAVTKRVINFPLDARTLYENKRLGYITNQAIKFQGDWANFLPRASMS